MNRIPDKVAYALEKLNLSYYHQNFKWALDSALEDLGDMESIEGVFVLRHEIDAYDPDTDFSDTYKVWDISFREKYGYFDLLKKNEAYFINKTLCTLKESKTLCKPFSHELEDFITQYIKESLMNYYHYKTDAIKEMYVSHEVYDGELQKVKKWTDSN